MPANAGIQFTFRVQVRKPPVLSLSVVRIPSFSCHKQKAPVGVKRRTGALMNSRSLELSYRLSSFAAFSPQIFSF